MCVSSEHRAQLPAATGDQKGAAALLGGAWLAPGMRTSTHAFLGTARGKSHLVSIFSSVSTVSSQVKWQEILSPDSKKKKTPNIQDKKPPGCCLSVDKLTTEMQTAGSPKALGNQQL